MQELIEKVKVKAVSFLECQSEFDFSSRDQTVQNLPNTSAPSTFKELLGVATSYCAYCFPPFQFQEFYSGSFTFLWKLICHPKKDRYLLEHLRPCKLHWRTACIWHCSYLATLQARDPDQPEFLQAVTEVSSKNNVFP